MPGTFRAFVVVSGLIHGALFRSVAVLWFSLGGDHCSFSCVKALSWAIDNYSSASDVV
jgi:hypothetical protein